MLKNKKSLAVILSFVMVLALSCSAWAAVGVRANGVSADVVAPITTMDKEDYGAYASNGGYITNDGHNIATSGDTAHGIFAYASSASVKMSGDITTSGNGASGARANNYASASMKGDIKTFGGSGHGISANNNSYLSMNGTIETSGDTAHGAYANDSSSMDITATVKTVGYNAYGVWAYGESYINITGDITTSGKEARGVRVNGASSASVNGDIKTSNEKADGVSVNDHSTLVMTGNIVTSGYNAIGASSGLSSDVTIIGDITVSGMDGYGIRGANNSIVNMQNGTLTISDESSSAIALEEESIANLTDVTIDAQTLLVTTTTGTLNASDNSDLNGDVIHGGMGGTAETLEINLTDSTMTGAVLTSPGIGNMTGGEVDITLENSDWIVTGDSNTNGTLTGDGNSSVDFSQAPDGTVVAVDEIVGEIDFGLKVGDQLNVTNTDGNNTFSSSDQDVLGVEQNADGSWSIVSKGEGEAELTYTYKDSNGQTQTVTTDVTSVPDSTGNTGGSTPGTYSGGSSSNCNAGMGFWAMLSLLGMVVIQKRK